MDEGFVSNEVRALVERMGQFPQDFTGPAAYWKDEFISTFCENQETPLKFLLTTEEFRLLKEAYREAWRRNFSEDVLKRIINPKQREFDFGNNNR